MKKSIPTPTLQVYGGFDEAYKYFNDKLFGGMLPPCLITVRAAGKQSLGYFSPERFGAVGEGNGGPRDEIAINIRHFKNRTSAQTFSTLVHEMVHLWQHHYGNAPKGIYHNVEWADQMESVGLMPSDTGHPGGARTGHHMTHYIIPNGPFDRAFKARPFEVPYFDRAIDAKKAAKKVKTTYVCAGCGAKAWGKPDMNLVCGDCETVMEAAS